MIPFTATRRHHCLLPVLSFCVLVFCLLSSSLLWAQEQFQAAEAGKRRPRVGVALGGGNALGLAHIGILKYFEEHHIPIDYLTGTSMGGLVGGFYSTGLDSAQLELIVRDARWDDLLSPNYRFFDEPVVEKQEWNRQTGWLTLRFGKRFTLPAGINSGQALALLLSRQTQAYSNLPTFDDLPTPFRCVATDLVTGAPFVLERGSLPKALRATMALPGIFTPVNWDDKVLIDGGLTNNLPVDEARKMGADKVIAVVVETWQPSARQFTSLGAVLRQTASIAVLQNERQQAANADLVIRVQLAGVTGTDYEQSGKIIRQGYMAAKAIAEQLAPYAIRSDAEWEAYLAARKQRIHTAPDRGPLVAVASPQPAIQRNATHELYRKLGATPFPAEQLEDALAGVVAATGLPGAYYEWRGDPGQQEGYRVEFLERPDQMLLMHPAISFSISSGEPSRAGLSVGASVIPFSTYKSRYLGEFDLGYDPGFRGEYYHPFDGSGYFIAPGLIVQRQHNSQYQGQQRQTFIRDRFAGSFYAGLGTWRFVQLRAGVRAGYDSYSASVTVDGVTAESGPFADPEVVLIFNNQDSGAIPSRGTRLESAAGYSYRAHSFPFFRNQFTSFHPAGKRVSLFARGQVDTSFGKSLGFFDQFTVGGEHSLEAYRYQEFHAKTLFAGGPGVLIHGPAIKSLSTKAILGVWYEAARLDLGSPGWQTHQSTATGLFFPTPVGALGASVAFNENGKARFRLSLGSF
jgi:NTE family protein